jgi:hypothetical protein
LKNLKLHLETHVKVFLLLSVTSIHVQEISMEEVANVVLISLLQVITLNSVRIRMMLLQIMDSMFMLTIEVSTIHPITRLTLRLITCLFWHFSVLCSSLCDLYRNLIIILFYFYEYILISINQDFVSLFDEFYGKLPI